MNFYPILRTKVNELLAVRELSAAIAARGNIFPLFEPVPSKSLLPALTAIAADQVNFGLIVNPSVGDYVGNPTDLHDEVIQPLIDRGIGYTPFFLVNSDTRLTTVQRFINRFRPGDLGVIFYDEPDDANIVTDVLAEHRFKHFVVFTDRTPGNFANQFSIRKLVRFRDAFNRAEKNAEYPADEFFTDQNNPAVNTRDVHYGNYSIAGEHFADGGGPAYAVALHHVYLHSSGNQHIRHYISDVTDTPTDPAGKFIEALRKLVGDLPRLGTANNTTTCDVYRDLLRRRHFPNLGPAKKLAIRHHLEIVMK